MDFGIDAFRDRRIVFDESGNGIHQSRSNDRGRYLVFNRNYKGTLGFTLELLDQDEESVVLLKSADKDHELKYVTDQSKLPEWFDCDLVGSGVNYPVGKAIDQIVGLYAFDTIEVQEALAALEIGSFVKTQVPDDCGIVVRVEGPILRVKYAEPWVSLNGKIQETNFDMTRRIWQEFVAPVSEQDVQESVREKLR